MVVRDKKPRTAARIRNETLHQIIWSQFILNMRKPKEIHIIRDKNAKFKEFSDDELGRLANIRFEDRTNDDKRILDAFVN